MNPKLIPILQRIIARDSVLRAFEPDNLPQSALAYVRGYYLNDNFLWLTPEEQDLLEDLPPFADNLKESIRSCGGIGNPDSNVYHLFDDGSLWLKTNAYSSVWADARDYAVECILPEMRLSRMEAELLRAIGMGDAVDEVRQDFFHAFAESLHKSGGIPHSEARKHWGAYARQLPFHQVEEVELGGHDRGEAEARDYLEWCRSIA